MVYTDQTNRVVDMIHEVGERGSGPNLVKLGTPPFVFIALVVAECLPRFPTRRTHLFAECLNRLPFLRRIFLYK